MTEAVDFRKLLDVQADTIHAPKALPQGLYFGNIKSFKTDVSQNKNTPFVRFEYAITHADESIDPKDLLQEDGTPIELHKKNLRSDFYLTEDAKFRLVKFLDEIGLNTKGRLLSELLPETQGMAVQLDVIAKANRNDPEAPWYNEVAKVTGVK